MGQPPLVQSADPPVWVDARQYTGRIVRMTNDKIFDSPVYNYTREFPWLWEEIHIPVRYQDDRKRVEQILLDVGRKHTGPFVAPASEALRHLRGHFTLPDDSNVEPAVYFRITDNWAELTLRFIVPQRGIRPIKDAMNRDIMDALDAAKIGIASATYDIVGFPPIRIEDTRRGT
jgi:small-conductance mechanosensitive channel